MMNGGQRVLRLVLTAGVAVSISACSASRAPSEWPEIDVSGLAPVTSSAQFDLPLTRFFPLIDDLVMIDRGLTAYKEKCAARFGVDEVVPVQTPEMFESEFDVSRRYGLVNRDEAEVFGYGMPPAPWDDEDKESGGLSSLAEEVYYGVRADGSPSTMVDVNGDPVPEGGCMDEGGFAFLDGADAIEVRTGALMLLGDAWGDLITHPVYVAAEADWVSCMADLGYEFEHRWDAGNSVASADPERQREMALMDLGCAEQTNFIARAMAADQQVQEAAIAENEATLRAALDEVDVLVARAEEAVR